MDIGWHACCAAWAYVHDANIGGQALAGKHWRGILTHKCTAGGMQLEHNVHSKGKQCGAEWSLHRPAAAPAGPLQELSHPAMPSTGPCRGHTTR